jgi:hypothetical protein
MDRPRIDHLKLAAARLVLPVLAMIVVLAGSAGLFVAALGWERFLLDFWPLDDSRVGPNLCASLVVVILITAHNVYRAVLQEELHHERMRAAVKDTLGELLPPAAERRADRGQD